MHSEIALIFEVYEVADTLHVICLFPRNVTKGPDHLVFDKEARKYYQADTWQAVDSARFYEEVRNIFSK